MNPEKTRPKTLMLRLPEALYEHVKATAAEQGVSMNLWIVCVLAGEVNFKPQAKYVAPSDVCSVRRPDQPWRTRAQHAEP